MCERNRFWSCHCHSHSHSHWISHWISIDRLPVNCDCDWLIRWRNCADFSIHSFIYLQLSYLDRFQTDKPTMYFIQSMNLFVLLWCCCCAVVIYGMEEYNTSVHHHPLWLVNWPQAFRDDTVSTSKILDVRNDPCLALQLRTYLGQ